MPTEAERANQATQNETFADCVCFVLKDHFAWAVTALFYSVVHLSRAFMSRHGAPAITSHKSFETEFLRFARDRSLYKLYRRMKDESEAARYDCRAYTVTDVQMLKKNVFEPCKAGFLK